MAEHPRAPGEATDEARGEAIAEGDDLPPTAEELAEAAHLRDALDAADDAHPLVSLAAAVRHAARPGELPEERAHALAAAAVAHVASPKARVRRLRAAFATTTATLALAAAAILALRTSPPPASLRAARSTEPLFVAPVVVGSGGVGGDATARIDRIAVARADDFRDNRFARWGAK